MEQALKINLDALNEGRRIYLGNLPYRATPYEIESLLAANGFDKIESIHISVDPVTARNPGYCFIDFPDKTTADRAISCLSAQIDGRCVKVGPCEPKKQSSRRFNCQDEYAFKSGDRSSGQGIQQGPIGALVHFDDIVENSKDRRLFVGGLPQMINQAEHNSEIAELLGAFNPTAIGKRITPDEYTRSFPGNHHYCFVDFENKADMDAAVKALNGTIYQELG